MPLLVAFQGKLMTKLGGIRKRQMLQTDERVKQTNGADAAPLTPRHKWPYCCRGAISQLACLSLRSVRYV